MIKMKKVFIGLSGGAGPMIRCLPIAIELQKRGFEIYYYSRDYSSHYMDLYGFHQVPVTYPKRYDGGLGITSKWIDLEHFAATYENEYEYFEQKYTCWIQFMKDLKPDLIISDFSLESSISAIVLDIPLVSISQGCYLYPIKNGSIRWWEDTKKPDECRILDNLNRFLAKYNKKGYTIFEEIFLDEKVYISSIPEFDTLEGMEDIVTYTGPILWQGIDNEKKAKITKNSATEGRSKIFVYMGRLTDTCGDTGILINRAISEAAKHIDADFVFSNGNFEEIKEPNLENVSVNKKWISIEEIYSDYDLVIQHGGHNSCLGTLVYGTPSYIIPTHTEREFNARKMQKMGVAKMILPEEITEAQIEKDINELLTQASYREKSKMYQNKIAQIHPQGEIMIADYVESVIGK